MRFSLVRVNEHVDAIALAAVRRARNGASKSILAVLAATRSIVSGHTNLTWVTAGSGWVTLVAPILVAAPFTSREKPRSAGS